MLIPRDPMAAYTMNLLPAGARCFNESPNLANVGLLAGQFGGLFQHGVVLRCGVGMYDAIVRTDANPNLPCIQPAMGSHTGTGYGVGSAQMLGEGTPVLVYVARPQAPYGIILGAGASVDVGNNDKLNHQANMTDTEPGATQTTEQAYREPQVDPKYLTMTNAQSGRPADLFPGNVCWYNEHGVGLSILNMATGLQASKRAMLELFTLDDTVRLHSGHFQHFSAAGEHRIYNDFGNVTEEHGVSPYQCEVSGMLEFDQAPMTVTEPGKDMKQCNFKGKEPQMQAIRRLQTFVGHLGNMAQMFVQAPDPGTTTNTYSKTPNNRGLFRAGVDAGGRLIVQSAGDIVIERWDKIPVPKKLREAIDPEGDKLEDDPSVVAEKKPFEWSKPKDQLSHALEQRDYIAWAQKLLDQRFAELSAQQGKKDWHFPEVKDTPTPDDEYDKIGKGKEKFSDDAGRSCQIVLRKDGGITVREHEGAEISLAGGKVIITAPKGVELRSGKSVVVLAHDDAIIKGRNSVDITATEKDVRIKAEGNLHQYAGKGILLEAAGTSGSHGMAKGVVGEQVNGSGIVLKADKSRIFAHGKIVHLAGKQAIFSETVEDDGMIIQSCRQYMVASDTNLQMTAPGTGLILTTGFAAVIGTQAWLLAESGAGVIKGSKFAVPLTWADIGQPVHTQISGQLAPTYNMVRNDVDWLKPYEPAARTDIAFTYRNEQQYGTNKDFTMYESLWAYRARKGDSVIEKAEPWKEKKLNDTWPWPGEQAYTGSGVYYQLKQETNIEDAATGVPKARKERKETGGGFTGLSFQQYAG